MRLGNTSLRPLVLLFFAASFGGVVHADPCDFTGADAFSWQQVMDCYRSVLFQPAELDNTIEVLGALRPNSDLDELYEQRYGWRANLEALDDVSYPDDFSMHDAIRLEHKLMKNPHVRYLAPRCYTGILAGYLPFDFGVTTRFSKGETQIVFIEDAPILPELYHQTTEIDPREYIGMKVESINGVPTLEYFRQFGRTSILFDESDSTHLNLILNGLSYSLRSSTAHDFAPNHPEDVMVLKSRTGKTVEVAFPWIFAQRSLLGMGQLAPTKSTTEFVELCNTPYPLPFSDPSAGDLGAAQLSGDEPIDPEKSRFVRHHISGPKVTDKDFFEVPPGQFDEHIEEIIPWTDGAKVLQFKDDTTVIRLFNTLDWIDVARQGIEHACQNSENLILDVRRNGGGNDVVIQWLYTHLFPDVPTAVDAGKIPVRTRNDRPDLNELLEVAAQLDELVGIPCWGFGPSCWMDIDTETTLPIDDFDWFLDPSVSEERAGSYLSLSRQIGLGEYLVGLSPTFDAASCAGKFDKHNLIVLTDGTNCSGGYFLVSPFIENDRAIVVTVGGYVDEEIPMGICRGGLTFFLSIWPLIVNVAEAFDIPVNASPPVFNRDVESFMETFAAYRQDRTRLHFIDSLGYDLRVYVWSDSPKTDGYVYHKVLGAVEESQP